ncbi:aminodeoxychorismate/anthranilate synthase component II [Candidatus Woesearchaeota archaeon]|nr:aminodeoxychorismate/anthranilate synthase component II [Candidatus Woesearchaeota archaeon]
MAKKRLLLIDNYDSFVYNIYQAFRELGLDVDVVRNNEITIEEVLRREYGLVVISPGPGSPSIKRDFGVCSEVIRELNGKLPILGVCLGHQGIVSVFGGRVVRAEKPMHGKTSMISHDSTGLFKGIKSPLRVMRYHSLVAEDSSLPGCLRVTARSKDDGAIMSVEHRHLPIFGVQFHPESIMTESGKKILDNFCRAGR